MRDPNVETIKRFISERVDKAFLQTYGANACTLGTTADGNPCLTLYVDATKPHYAKVAGPGKISFKAPEGEIDIPVKVVEAGATRFDKGGKSATDRVPGGVGIWVPDYSNYAADWGTLGGWACHRFVALSTNCSSVCARKELCLLSRSTMVEHPPGGVEVITRVGPSEISKHPEASSGQRAELLSDRDGRPRYYCTNSLTCSRRSA